MTHPASTKFLVDENLSPSVAEALRADGHLAWHVNDTGHRSITDAGIMAWAVGNDATIITKDRDFEEMLFADRTSKPSVIRISERGADGISGSRQQVDALRQALPGLDRYLEQGVAVTIDRFGLRVDRLPLDRIETRRGRLVTRPDPTHPDMLRTDLIRARQRIRERAPGPPDRLR